MIQNRDIAAKIEKNRKALIRILAWCLFACLILRHRKNKPRRIFCWLAQIVLKAEIATCFLYQALSDPAGCKIYEAQIDHLTRYLIQPEMLNEISVAQLLVRIRAAQKRLRCLPNEKVRMDIAIIWFLGSSRLKTARVLIIRLIALDLMSGSAQIKDESLPP